MLDKYFEDVKMGNINNIKVKFAPGEKLIGRVVAIDSKSVFVDINGKSEGIINREEFIDKNGNLTIVIGEEIEAFLVSENNGEINLSVKMTGKSVAKHLDDAFYNKIPVEGKVTDERKGGYLVKIAGKDAFCPYSQIDLYPRDASNYIGKSYSFIITEMNKFDIVLSRRKLLEKDKSKRIAYLKENLNEGDVITGTVINIKDFGVFVNLDGCEGFIPISELAWGRIENPSEIVKINDEVKCSVKKLDWENNKITLSYKTVQTSWEEIAEKYPRGKVVNGKVLRLEKYGAFIELEKGIDGLLHISKVDPGRNITHAKQALNIGESIPVVIEDVNLDSKRISLARDFSGGEASSETGKTFYEEGSLEIGDNISGVVESIKPFGLFIRISPLESGLLHISEIKSDTNKNLNPYKTMEKLYPIGTRLTIEVKAISEDGKISFRLPENKEETEHVDYEKYSKQKTKNSFETSLGDFFNGLDI